MTSSKELKQLSQLIAICFTASLVVGFTPIFFSEVNTSNGSMLAKYFWQVSNLLYMVACCMCSLKAAQEEKLIAPSGFIILSIGVGTLFALQTASFNEEVNRTYASGILAYLPGMLLICYYDRFPLWLKFSGILACIPKLVTLILILNGSFDWEKHQQIDGSGYFFTNLVGVGWGWYMLKPMKKFREQPV